MASKAPSHSKAMSFTKAMRSMAGKAHSSASFKGDTP